MSEGPTGGRSDGRPKRRNHHAPWKPEAFDPGQIFDVQHDSELPSRCGVSNLTKPVMGKIMKAISDLPLAARKSITFDRGTEFVSWPHLQSQTGTQTWLSNRKPTVKLLVQANSGH